MHQQQSESSESSSQAPGDAPQGMIMQHATLFVLQWNSEAEDIFATYMPPHVKCFRPGPCCRAQGLVTLKFNIETGGAYASLVASPSYTPPEATLPMFAYR